MQTKGWGGEVHCRGLLDLLTWPHASSLSLCGCIKDQIYREISNNNTDLKAKVRHNTAGITEKTLQKKFKNIVNRLSYVIRPIDGRVDSVLI